LPRFFSDKGYNTKGRKRDLGNRGGTALGVKLKEDCGNFSRLAYDQPHQRKALSKTMYNTVNYTNNEHRYIL